MSKGYLKGALALLCGVAIGLGLAALGNGVLAQYSNPNDATRYYDGANAGDGAIVPPPNDASALLPESRPLKVPRTLEVPPIYAFESAVSPQCRQIAVVDSESKRICVYWIRTLENRSTIELVAARKFEWDLKLDDFNCEGLLPAQIQDQFNSTR